MRRARTATFGLVLGGAFYLLLIDTVSSPELYAGIAAMLLAGAAYEVSREQGFSEATIALRWLLRGFRVLSRAPGQVLIVCGQAFAQVLDRQATRGKLRAVSFRAGGEGPYDAGRRALTEALGSLTPNTIVIGIDPDRDLLLVHQLRVQGGRDELDQMGLG